MTEEPSTIRAPLYRTDLEALLEQRNYTTQHLSILSWLIWFSLLSREELLRMLIRKEPSQMDAEAKNNLFKDLRSMSKLGLIDDVMLRESSFGRHKRYYATDLGLYLYLAAVHSSPPLSIARLARSYPIERDDLLARLARPHLHCTCMSLVAQIIAEGEVHGDYLTSYQLDFPRSWRVSERCRV